MADLLKNDPLLRHLEHEEDGVHIGHVVLKSKIGAGGMGAVYLGRHIGLDIDVAVKILPLEDDEEVESTSVMRFTREAQTAARINHPNLVRVYALGEIEGLKYIIQEYVDGLPGGEWLEKNGAMPEQTALEVIAQVCLALQAAHEESVIHRDVKPDNILIQSDGIVKLADLGLAKKIDIASSEEIKINFDITAANTAVGTPHFMAPEQITNAKDVDFHADIYSLGVTLFQFLSLDLPFTADNIYALFHSVLHEQGKSLQEVKPGLLGGSYRLVEWMMQKDPNKRPDSAQMVFESIDNILACKEQGSDDWYPPGYYPPQQPVVPLTLEISGIPAKSLPSASREAKVPPMSTARQRLIRMKSRADEMAKEGKRDVEFVIPDILKDRNRLSALRSDGGASQGSDTDRQAPVHNPEIADKTKHIILRKRGSTGLQTPKDISLKKLRQRKKGTRLSESVEQDRRLNPLPVKSLSKRKGKLLPGLAALLIILGLGALLWYRGLLPWKSVGSDKTVVNKAPRPPTVNAGPRPKGIPKTSPKKNSKVEIESWRASVEKAAEKFGNLRWNEAVMLCRSITEEIGGRSDEPEMAEIALRTGAIIAAAEKMEQAADADTNAKRMVLELEAFDAAPPDIREAGFHFFMKAAMEIPGIEVTVVNEAGEPIGRFRGEKGVVIVFDARKATAVRFEKARHETLELPFEPLRRNGVELRLPVSFPDSVSLRIKPDIMLKLPARLLAGPVERQGIYYSLLAGNRLLVLPSFFTEIGTRHFECGGVEVESLNGLSPARRLFASAKLGNGRHALLCFNYTNRGRPLDWFTLLDDAAVSKPFPDRAENIHVVTAAGIETISSEGVKTGTVPVKGKVVGACRNGDALLLTTRAGGLWSFDTSRLKMARVPLGELPLRFSFSPVAGVGAAAAVSDNGVLYKIPASDTGKVENVNLGAPPAIAPILAPSGIIYVFLNDGRCIMVTGGTSLTIYEGKPPDFPAAVLGNELYWWAADKLVGVDATGTCFLDVKPAIDNRLLAPPQVLKGLDDYRLLLPVDEYICLFNLPIRE